MSVDKFKAYLRIQLMTLTFGLVGPLFLILYFVLQPDPTIRWMYWWGLLITAFDILLALWIAKDDRPSPGEAKRLRALRSRADDS